LLWFVSAGALVRQVEANMQLLDRLERLVERKILSKEK